MKKKYVKPELLYEQYMLNQHMASGCNFVKESTTTGESYVGMEGTEFEGMKIFLTDSACGPGQPAVELYCYYPSTSAIATVGLNGSGV